MRNPATDVDLRHLYQALAVGVQEVLRKASAAGTERDELEAAAWKAYEAAVRAAHASIEKMVANPAVGDAAAIALNTYLRGAQIANSLVGSLFAPLWTMVGLTPLTETQALFDRIESLRRELRRIAAPRALRSIEPVAPPRAPSSSRGRRAAGGGVSDKKPAPLAQ